jgi:hypothetical protein
MYNTVYSTDMYIYNIRTLSVNIKFICTSYKNRQNSELFRPVSQRVQMNFIFNDNIRILCLSCNVKKVGKFLYYIQYCTCLYYIQYCTCLYYIQYCTCLYYIQYLDVCTIYSIVHVCTIYSIVHVCTIYNTVHVCTIYSIVHVCTLYSIIHISTIYSIFNICTMYSIVHVCTTDIQESDYCTMYSIVHVGTTDIQESDCCIIGVLLMYCHELGLSICIIMMLCPFRYHLFIYLLWKLI